MRVLKFTIGINIIGCFVFNLLGFLKISKQVYQYGAWEKSYYIWDKSCWFLMFLASLYLVPLQERWVVRPVLILSLFRLLWLVIALLCGFNLNNQWWLALLFVILAVAAGYLTFQENSRANKWLSKYSP